MFFVKPQTPSFHIKHAPHRETLLKFIALALILVAYFFYMSWKYDASTGFVVSILTWSFFVLCTPIADGGFILAFPIRLLFGIKMAITQVVLWFVAIGVNGVILVYQPEVYDLSFITQLLKHILTEPYPYWAILILSALGTLLSIYFGDEMMDVASHKERVKQHRHGFKHRTILVVGLGALTIVAYYYLLDGLNITLQ